MQSLTEFNHQSPGVSPWKTGLENYSKTIDNRKLRFGYTTGSCAAAASKAAAYMLLTGQKAACVTLVTPKGISLQLEIQDIRREPDAVSCAVEKDAGDDPDITNGILIYARVSRQKEKGVHITGGAGIGMVTKPGLEQPPGSYAINSVPRQMITEELQKLCRQQNYSEGLHVELSVPGGQELAAHTFNPRLGIEGGISILGTTGIVEPMSEAALVSSIRLEINQQVQSGRKNIVVTPGNYGQEFLKQNLPISLENAVKCSNFIGETIDMAVELGVERLLFVSHIGKFIKVAGGIFQTHSRNADARMEILTANAALAGAGQPLLAGMMQALTTDDGLHLLEEAGYLEETMKQVMKRTAYYLDRRSYGKIECGAIVFSSEYGKRNHGSGELGRTENAGKILEYI